MIFTVELFGPLKGANKTINGHEFIDGVHVMREDPANAAFALKYFSYYNGFAKGTTEYEVAKLEELKNGADNIHTQTQEGKADSVRSDIQSNGTGPAEKTADNGNGYASDEAGDTGVHSNGNGYSDSGIPKFEEAADIRSPVEPQSEINIELQRALQKLNPDDNSHWVSTGEQAGKPKLSVVEQVYGKKGITRSDIEDALPGYSREEARNLI
jgi:hypothetical protein